MSEPTAMQLAFLDGGRRYYAKVAAKPPPGPVDPLTAANTAIERHDERRDREHRERYVLPKIKRDIGLVELYHRRRTIDDQQRSACEELARYYQASGFKPGVTMAFMQGSRGGGGYPPSGPRVVEYVQAMAAVGPSLQGVVFAFVIEDVAPSAWAHANRLPEDAGMILLRAGLDNLCYHLRFKQPPRMREE